MRTVTVGILALQGGVAEHAAMVRQAGAVVRLIRKREHLTDTAGAPVDALILPGGESSTIDRLLRLFDLAAPLNDLIRTGTPTLGTCAGLILLAKHLRDPAPDQQTFGELDVTVQRNAFGNQLASTSSTFAVEGVNGTRTVPVTGALIRAPRIVEVGLAARTIVTHEGHILGATSTHTGGESELGHVTGISFHPELTGNATFHRELVAQASRRLSPHQVIVDLNTHVESHVTSYAAAQEELSS